jgi:NADH-quinone oxidoreductase subunit G
MGKRVLPTNAALAYGGYELNDIMKALVGAPELTIDWTKMLPVAKGFKAVEFDSLPNAFTNDGRDNRGYRLDVTVQEVGLPSVEKFDENAVLEGDIAYRCNPARQFNDFTDKAHEIFEAFALYASPSKAESLGEKVEVVFANGTITLDVVADEKIQGDIVKVPDFKSAKDVYGLFGESRYQTVTLRKV